MPSHSEVNHVNWFQRMKEAITGVPLGILFIAVASYALFIGEKKHAETTILLKDTEPLVQLADHKQINPALDSQLVLISGPINSNEILKDELFGIKGSYLKMYRQVKMCQWQETIIKTKTEDGFGGKIDSITYEYNKIWHTDTIDSDKFKYKELYKNPKKRTYFSKEYSVKHAKLGRFTLSKEVIAELDKYSPIDISKTTSSKYKIASDTFRCLGKEVAGNAAIYGKQKLRGSYIFKGSGTAKDPQVGDYKFVYWGVSPEIYTTVLEQNGNILAPKTIKNGFSMSELNCGTNFNYDTDQFQLILSGTKTKEEMFEWAHDRNDFLYVIGLRLWGFLFMAGGFKRLFKPLAILPAWVPFLGGFSGKVVLRVAFLIACSLSFLIAGTSWLIYNKFENISNWDYYFLVLLFLIFIGAVRVKASTGEHSVDSSDLFET